MKIKYMKNRHNLLALIVCVLTGTMMTSCNKDDYATIYNPDNTESTRPGMLTINFTGSTITDTAAISTITMISTDGKTTYSIRPSQPVDVNEGRYTTIAQKLPAGASLPAGTTISQTGIISVPTSSDDSLLSLPDFEMAIGTVNVVYNTTLTETLALKQMTRKLNVKSMLTGVDPSKVRNITVTITGIASEKQIDGNVTNGKNHSVTTTLGIGADGVFNTDFHVLGIDSSVVQELTVTINYNDNSSYTFNANVSSILKDFNDESYETPAGLDISIKSNVDGLKTTILPWSEGWNEGGLGE